MWRPALLHAYSTMAPDCASTRGLPGASWSTMVGIWPPGFIARYSGVLLALRLMSTGITLCGSPHSAIAIVARRPFVVPHAYTSIMLSPVPLGVYFACGHHSSLMPTSLFRFAQTAV